MNCWSADAFFYMHHQKYDTNTHSTIDTLASMHADNTVLKQLWPLLWWYHIKDKLEEEWPD
jgi:hypothetical protein